MVDRNADILDLFTHNVAKADALSNEIDSIALHSGQSRKSLISILKPIPTPLKRSARYDRWEIYEKVWKTPMKDLALEYGVSDSGLRKACTRLQVPVPARGRWAKMAAGKPVAARPALSGLGQSDDQSNPP